MLKNNKMKKKLLLLEVEIRLLIIIIFVTDLYKLNLILKMNNKRLKENKMH
jgi:hypothetical protein